MLSLSYSYTPPRGEVLTELRGEILRQIKPIEQGVRLQ